MPPIEVASFGDELVAAARRQPVEGADVFRREANAIGHLLRPIRVVLAGAGTRIEQLAADMGEIDLAGIFLFELFQAAAPAAVTQALPFGVGHLFQRLGFPEESLLV